MIGWRLGGEQMAREFTAETARAIMPDVSKFEELVADCHMRIGAAAAKGKYEVHCGFSIDRYNRSHFSQLEDFLKKEGYNVMRPLLSNYFIIDWRDK
jgi:hypothetical protein